MKNIMLIEDDFDTQILYAECLRAENFDVVSASNAVEALEHIKQFGFPDVIVMDLNFPMMGPEEFLETIRGTEEGQNIPVLIISGKSDIRERAQRLRAKGFLQKPFGIDPFVSIIAREANAS